MHTLTLKTRYLTLLYSLVMAIISSNVNAKQVSTEQPSLKPTQQAPNILFIYTDDQAPWAMGHSGNLQAITPNIDALANEGMYFPNAYTTTPVCSPSRAGLMTSRYGYELGIDDWINTIMTSLSGREDELGLSNKYPTWPLLLQKAGYHTGLVGKWHLGELAQHHPTQLGYNEFQGFIAGGTKTQHPVLEINGEETKFAGLTADILTDLAMTFLQHNKSKKFALSLHYRAPHTQWLPVAPEDAAPYENVEMKLPHPDYPGLDADRARVMMKEYLSSVRSIDRNLGRLMTLVDSLGLRKSTLIVFTSDHGYNLAHNGMWHKGNGHWLLKEDTKAQDNIPSNQRPNMYDNSVKVPMIVSWPTHIPVGSINQTTFSNLDWFPTLLSIARSASDSLPLIRGQDKSSSFFDAAKTLSTDYYAAYSTKHQSISGMRMYSDGKYKLIKDLINKERDELYDLRKDPEETINLITSKDPETVRIITRLSGILFEHMRKTNDPLL